MRKLIITTLLVIIAVSAGFLVFRLLRKTPKTLVGWHAHVTTVAGDGSPAFRDAPQRSQTAFADPFGIAVGPDGAVYVADAGDSNRIRKIAPDGSVTTIAGGREGRADGPGAQASFNTPSGLALDSNGNLYVADTGNNSIRKITPQGVVSTVAGDGTAGYRDGPATQARFDGPIGIAVDTEGNIYVADTYNDRVRMISTAGQVTTIAGATGPGYADGDAANALFDTPCAIAVAVDGSVIVADTGNGRLRKLNQGKVTTLPAVFQATENSGELGRPVGLVLTHDGFLYVTELDRGRVVQIAPDGTARIIAGGSSVYADGIGTARFHQLAGVAIDRNGDLYVADGGNYLVRKLSQTTPRESDRPFISHEPLPRLTSTTLDQSSLLWPLDPQQHPHEVAATMGEVRGSFDSKDSRDHLHSGLDIFGAYGDTVRAIRAEKVVSPLSNWGFGSLNEGFRVGVISYIHIQVGRDQNAKLFADPRFIPVRGDDGKLQRMRVRRGTRFRPGDALGTINRMYHVHLNVGPPGAEINPLSLSPIGFADKVPPQIEADGIQLFDEAGKRLVEMKSGRLVVHGKVRIVVDAFDRTDMNASRRRLGLYRLGYQILRSDGTPDPHFAEPRINIVFDRLPGDEEETKITYAEQSGITVYGSATTRFLYEVTNTVRDGRVERNTWDASALPAGDYILRIIATDYSGNEAQDGRDVLITIK